MYKGKGKGRSKGYKGTRKGKGMKRRGTRMLLVWRSKPLEQGMPETKRNDVSGD